MELKEPQKVWVNCGRYGVQEAVVVGFDADVVQVVFIRPDDQPGDSRNSDEVPRDMVFESRDDAVMATVDTQFQETAALKKQMLRDLGGVASDLSHSRYFLKEDNLVQADAHMKGVELAAGRICSALAQIHRIEGLQDKQFGKVKQNRL